MKQLFLPENIVHSPLPRNKRHTWTSEEKNIFDCVISECGYDIKRLAEATNLSAKQLQNYYDKVI